jgi:uncharacterized repeat protein (TIGR01451 family)
VYGYTPLNTTSHDFGLAQSGSVYSHTFVNQRNEFNVSIDKVGPATAIAGDNITYTLNWSVTGNTPVDVVLTDVIPVNTTFVSASVPGTLLGFGAWNALEQYRYLEPRDEDAGRQRERNTYRQGKKPTAEQHSYY